MVDTKLTVSHGVADDMGRQSRQSRQRSSRLFSNHVRAGEREIDVFDGCPQALLPLFSRVVHVLLP